MPRRNHHYAIIAILAVIAVIAGSLAGRAFTGPQLPIGVAPTPQAAHLMPAAHQTKPGAAVHVTTGKPYTIPVSGTDYGQLCATTGACTQAMLLMINGERAAVGSPPLVIKQAQQYGTTTCVGTRGHSRAMAASHSIWHVNVAYPAASFATDMCNWISTAGENVGEAGGNKWSAILTINGLMMAEPWTPGCQGNHRCSLLFGGYHSLGVWVSTDSAGNKFLTEDFSG